MGIDKKLLSTLHMTDKELQAFNSTVRTATLMLKLPQPHPMEREETCHDIHKLQLRLLARPGLRVIGWKEGAAPWEKSEDR